jgi:hypothetical protein
MQAAALSRFLGVLMLALAACKPYNGPPGTITNVVISQNGVVTGSVNAAQEVEFIVEGQGTCAEIVLIYGNGEFQFAQNVDLSARPVYKHTYRPGWPGPKTVTVRASRNCQGSVSKPITLTPSESLFLLRTPITGCMPLGTVRAGSVISVLPSASPEAQITFSAFERHGIAGSTRAAPGEGYSFPFPGLREYSLVFRVNLQTSQGGVGRPFTVENDGMLEACVNDDVPGDNFGFWSFLLGVDESPVQWSIP